MSDANLRQHITDDAFRYFGKRGVRPVVHGFLRIPGFRYTTLLRIARSYGRWHPLGLAFGFWQSRMGSRYGYQIPAAVELGPGFYVGHFGPIVMNREVVIGANCNIAHNCTIGQANRGRNRGVPRLGNQVWIGTGAIIVGGITIGDDVLIAPGAYVNEDVPDHSLVLGNPAVVTQRGEGVVDGYINNRVSVI